MRENQVDVLVVGAGPVGLSTALLLAESGFNVRVIDREHRITSRSYACALHPRTLQLLERAGLASEIIGQGRKISRIAFYEGQERKADLNMAKLGGDFPYLLIVSQAVLEGALERKLMQTGVTVSWNHRFDELHENRDTVVVNVEKLGGTSTGYIVPHWETVVERSFELTARFVIGADGHSSLVRRRLGVAYDRLAGPEFFAAYEFESDTPAEDEVRVALEQTTTNVLWPLAGNRQRWTFQLTKGEIPAEFPEKERRAARLEQSAVDERIKHYVEAVAGHRAPWFKAPVRAITWCTEVAFEHGLVAEFGRGRCWLAGDAAHQTGPVGAQSMNVGVFEGAILAGKITDILQGKTGLEQLRSYNEERQAEWQALLGQRGALAPREDTAPWVRQRAERLLSCIPCSGDEFTKLVGQLKLDFQPLSMPVSR